MLEYWFMLPVALTFASIAMATGIGGAAMFTPFFLLVLKIPASLAVGIGLFIEVFGFGSGLIGFAKKDLIDYEKGIYLLCFTVPAAIIGALIAGYVPDIWIKLFLATLLLLLSMQMTEFLPTLKRSTFYERCHEDKSKCSEEPPSTALIGVLGALGGLIAGLVSTGVGEMNDYILIKEYEMHGPVAAGTSVFIVAITVLIGSVTHVYNFFTHHLSQLNQVLGILLFTIPGVLIGAQSGVWLSQKMTEEQRNNFIGGLFLLLAVVIMISVLL